MESRNAPLAAWSFLTGGRLLGPRAQAWARGEVEWIPCVEVLPILRGPLFRGWRAGRLVIDGDVLQWRFRQVCYTTPRPVPGSLTTENLTVTRLDQFHVEHYRAPDGTTHRLGTTPGLGYMLALNTAHGQQTYPPTNTNPFPGPVIPLDPITRQHG